MKKHHFAVRTDRDTLDKFKFVAAYHGRSANRELEQLMMQHISNFENEHGPIFIETDSIKSEQ